ncbi:MAG: glycerophosphodiester phosphodiesterase [Actinomycetota bacterium]|nr:glycerophosphodiester phosphodiesterase [Actinomycetota bacterium]
MQIYGHRGVLARRPGNTVEGVALAFADGADGVEIDVRRTADGRLVCCHDPRVAFDNGTRMRLLAQTDVALQASTFRGGYRLARPEELLDVAAGRRVIVEIKNNKLARDYDVTATASANALLELLDARAAAGCIDVVSVSSFDIRVIDAVRAARPDLVTGYLTRYRTRVRTAISRAIGRGHAECHLHVSSLLADPGGVSRLNAAGLQVIGWTVNAPEDAHILAAAGVNGVITDDPLALRTALG